MAHAAYAMRRSRWAVLVALGGLALALPAPAAAVRSHCSTTGDVCYGAFGTGTTVQLRVTTIAHVFNRYTLCVRAPGGTRACRRFRMHPGSHGTFSSSVRWSAHFPSHGPGRYRATWNFGSGAARPAITFKEGPTIHATPATVRAGQRVRISGLAGGCPKGDRVTLLSRAFPHTHDFAGLPAVFAT